MKKQKSGQNGGSKDAATELPLDTQSTSVELTKPQENHHISVMLDTTARQSKDSPATEKPLGVGHNANYANLISALADKLGDLIEWRKITLKDGRSGWALFFSSDKWLVDPTTRELTPLGEK